MDNTFRLLYHATYINMCILKIGFEKTYEKIIGFILLQSPREFDTDNSLFYPVYTESLNNS